MAIQMRRGEKKDFKPEKLKIGEFAVPTDTGEVYIKTGEDTAKGIATLDLSGKLEQMPTHEDVGAAAKGHKHPASDITSGTLPIERGGTGAKTVTEAQSALKIFTDISQLNVDYPCSTGDIVNAMPAGSIGLFNVEASSCTVTDVATGFSFLEIYKATPNRVRVLLNGSPSDGLSTGSTFSIGQYNAATHTIESWKRIQTSAFATPINCGGTGATTYKDVQKNFHFYTDLAQLWISAPCTTADVVNILPISSIFLLGTESVSASITDAPTGYGFFAIFNGANPNRKMGLFARSLTNTENYEAGNWFYIMNVANGVHSWQKVLTNVSTDNSLLTNSKTIVGAINEIYTKLKDSEKGTI